jgi:predicted amidophosphoribosyltransferase
MRSAAYASQPGSYRTRSIGRLAWRGLSVTERWESVRGAFATKIGSRVDNLRVLLVDDVMTTGATLDACSRALPDAGAKEVIGLKVALAVGNSHPQHGFSPRDT